jgi:hypothetical protein
MSQMPLWQLNVVPAQAPFEQSNGPPAHAAPIGREETQVWVVESQRPLPHCDADVHAAAFGSHAMHSPAEPQYPASRSHSPSRHGPLDGRATHPPSRQSALGVHPESPGPFPVTHAPPAGQGGRQTPASNDVPKPTHASPPAQLLSMFTGAHAPPSPMSGRQKPLSGYVGVEQKNPGVQVATPRPHRAPGFATGSTSDAGGTH